MSEGTQDGCLPRFLRLFGYEKAATAPSVLPAPAPPVTTPAPDIQTTPARQQPKVAFSPDDVLPYHLRNDFLSLSELAFYRLLQEIVGQRVVIFSKVRLADIFHVEEWVDNRVYFSKIAQKHVDFLFCHPKSLRPLCAIELDDNSHRLEDRKIRDTEVNAIFNAAGFRLLHIVAKNDYDREEVAAQLSPYLTFQNAAEPGDGKTGVSSDPPFCPRCGSQTVRRKAQQGVFRGSEFWGCVEFPDCRGRINIVE